MPVRPRRLRCALLLKVVMPLLLLRPADAAVADEPNPAATTSNVLGVRLLQLGADTSGNTLFSPFVLQMGLAQLYAGTAGTTREEMRVALGYPTEEAALHRGFSELRARFEDEVARGAGDVWAQTRLTCASRLFVQTGFVPYADFLATLDRHYGSVPALLNFRSAPVEAARVMNDWASTATRGRIPALVPPGGLPVETRIALLCAVHFKGRWASAFAAAHPAPFRRPGAESRAVPMIQQRGHFRYQRLPGFATVAIPFRSEFDLVILLPDEIDGLPGLQRTLEPAVLAASTQAFAKDVRLTMPVFRLESPALLLKRALGQLGVRSVFDVPEGSADLTRMAPRPGGDYLALSEAWHRAEIQVDRLGVEGSAGMTVPPGTKRGPIPGTPTPTPVPPIEFRVDHPFLFALLHRPSGACLFLGRVAQLDGTNAPRAVAAFPTPAPAQDGIRELILDFDAPEVEPDDEAGAEVRTEPR